MTDLFFIALLPPKEIAAKYESSHALKSPPHITLIPPFKCGNDFKKIIIEPLTDFFNHIAPFVIRLNGFSCFERNRVIFIDVINNVQLEKTYYELQNFAGKNLPVKFQEKHGQFTPHLTIASRDLRKGKFREAWNVFKEKTFSANFSVHSAWLLRHSGTEWIPYCEFTFKKK
ncbi:MAG TPA: 2'-5' RNA ligase family protein [Bacteroidia bacterium]|nr:2'-5' RNA ligase family protein [Bacteroidia bacterium]